MKKLKKVNLSDEEVEEVEGFVNDWFYSFSGWEEEWKNCGNKLFNEMWGERKEYFDEKFSKDFWLNLNLYLIEILG